jgi:hypothetical protein
VVVTLDKQVAYTMGLPAGPLPCARGCPVYVLTPPFQYRFTPSLQAGARAAAAAAAAAAAVIAPTSPLPGPHTARGASQLRRGHSAEVAIAAADVDMLSSSPGTARQRKRSYTALCSGTGAAMQPQQQSGRQALRRGGGVQQQFDSQEAGVFGGLPPRGSGRNSPRRSTSSGAELGIIVGYNQ